MSVLRQFAHCNECDDESARSSRADSLRSRQVVIEPAGEGRIKTKGFVTARKPLSHTHTYIHHFSSQHICHFLWSHRPLWTLHFSTWFVPRFSKISSNHTRRLSSPDPFLHVDFSRSGRFHTGIPARERLTWLDDTYASTEQECRPRILYQIKLMWKRSDRP